MKIPKKLKIGGHNYAIIQNNTQKTNADSRLGTADIYKNKIWVDTAQSQTQQESTLLHEIIEVINEVNLLKLSEESIRVLEGWLYQVLKDNNLLKS